MQAPAAEAVLRDHERIAARSEDGIGRHPHVGEPDVGVGRLRLAVELRVVQQLDARPISDLTDLLGQVQCTRVYPRTHPGIQ